MSVQELPVENLYKIWKQLRGTLVPKTEAKKFFIECFEKYRISILYKEWPLDETKYGVASVSDFKEEYFYGPKEKLLTSDGKQFYTSIIHDKQNVQLEVLGGEA